MSYPVGQEVVISGEFRDAANVLTDPTTVKLKVRDPNGGERTFTFGSSAIVKASTGRYRFALVGTTAGRWRAKWVTRGGLTVASAETVIEFDPTQLVNPL